MRNDSLQQFIKLRRELTEEGGRLEMRLRQINEALGEMPLPSLSPIQGAIGQSTGAFDRARRGRPSGAGQSLRDHVLAVLQNGPMTKEEVLAAVQKRGYKFSTNNPMNSLGVILYGKNPKFNRIDGKFNREWSSISRNKTWWKEDHVTYCPRSYRCCSTRKMGESERCDR